MVNKLSSDSCRFKLCKFTLDEHVGDSGVTVIMAASQAVDPGSTPGCRTRLFILFYFFFQAKHVSGSFLIFCCSLWNFYSPKFSIYFFHSKFQRGRTRTTSFPGSSRFSKWLPEKTLAHSRSRDSKEVAKMAAKAQSK